MRIPRPPLSAPALALAGTAVLAALARLQFVQAGVGSDEGGYAYIAREWARGGDLYGDLWLDRPQGLLLVYRAITAIAEEPWAVRGAALLFGVGITLLVGVIGWLLRGPWTGVAAAAIYAVVGAGPHIQGFTLNAELVAALPATGAVAAAVVWWRRGGERWLIVAGLLGGAAVLMKQSGFDGLVAAAALAAAAGGASVGTRLRAVGLVALGALVPLGAAVVHALTIGFGKYWSAVVEFRAAKSGDDSLDWRWYLFTRSLHTPTRDLLLITLVALVGAFVLLRRRAERVVVFAWLAAAFVAFNAGGLYWSHYYVQLVPPLALLAGIAATGVRPRVLGVALGCVAVLQVGAILVERGTRPTAKRLNAVRYYKQFKVDERVAAIMRARTRPGDPIYVVGSHATVYWLADRPTAYPYLWHHSPLGTPAGLAQLRRVFRRPDRPKVIALYRSPNELDRSGALAREIYGRYRLVARPAPDARVLVPRSPPFTDG